MDKQGKSRLKKYAVTVAAIVMLVWLAVHFLLQPTPPLPVLGEPGHTVGHFSFTDQDNKMITDRDVEGKIRVVEYFFTTCKSICPKMNDHLKLVQEAFKDRENVVILSHTVNPSTDSAAVLKKYADRMQAIPGKWLFLTGPKIALYQMAEQSYLLSADTTTITNEADAFIHTKYVALIDQEDRIRGFYDATDKKAINKLIADIHKL